MVSVLSEILRLLIAWTGSVIKTNQLLGAYHQRLQSLLYYWFNVLYKTCWQTG